MPNRNKKASATRKPHNVRMEHYESFNEILATIAGEPREAIIGEKRVIMTRMEGLLRVQVDRALKRNVREIAMLLKMMANDPGLAVSALTREVAFISWPLSNV